MRKTRPPPLKGLDEPSSSSGSSSSNMVASSKANLATHLFDGAIEGRKGMENERM